MIHQYQQFRRMSNQSPPLGVPLVSQKRWDTNPSIFIEEYNDDEPAKSQTESKSESHNSARNSKETLCSSNESLQPLSETDIKSFGDLSQIPFIDEDSNEAAPCRFDGDGTNRSGIISGGNQRNTCRKTVSFDVIAGRPSGHQHLFTNNGKHSPENPHSISYPTDKSQLFLGSHRLRANVRPSRDGINRTPQCFAPVPGPSSPSCDDHCPLVDKLIRMKLEDEGTLSPRPKCKKDGSADDSRVCEGKVKALTTYFNSLPYMMEDCNCVNVHQSTPDLSRSRNKLTFEEMEIVRKQLKEWSEFGLAESKPMCFSSPRRHCMADNTFNGCKQYREMLNKLDKAEKRRRKLHLSMENMYNPDCFFPPKPRLCHFDCQEKEIKVPHVRPSVLRSDKHKCRSPCYNIKDPAKKIIKKKESEMRKVAKSFPEEDSESFVI